MPPNVVRPRVEDIPPKEILISLIKDHFNLDVEIECYLTSSPNPNNLCVKYYYKEATGGFNLRWNPIENEWENLGVRLREVGHKLMCESLV